MADRWIDQTILHSDTTRGNCMQACVASILDLQLRDVPHFAADADKTAHYGFLRFMESHGFDVVRDDFHRSFDGYYLACGPTARGTHHMVVMRDGKLAHDPHPSKAGLQKIDFVYSLLARDPAIHVAAHEAADDEAAPLRTENETLRAERDAAQEDAEEQRGIAEERGENLRLIDAISDLIGVPHDVELELHHVKDALAERDAAIARAEALAKVSLIQARELKRMDPHGATPPDLDAAMADLRHALTTPEHPHGD